MTPKEKINERISRIKEYNEQVTKYRNMRAVSDVELKDIRVEFEADSPVEPTGCFKVKWYERSDGFDDRTPFVMRCEHFDDNGCPVSDCPYHAKHQQYIEHLRLLRDAKEVKRTAFKRIFEKIK